MSDSIRKNRKSRINTGDGDFLPVPVDVNVGAEDQSRFDSYVWCIEKLKENNNDNVIVLDARTKREYDIEHLPGAVQAHWTEWSNVGIPQGAGTWAVVYDNDKLPNIFASLGIDGSKPVVVYNDPLAGWGEEGRQLWSLRVAGIADSYILNGGLSAWKSNGNPVTADTTKINAVTPPLLKRDENIFASTDYLLENFERINILDVREDDEFAALKNYGEKALGRIPGAKQIWFKDFYYADGTILTPAEIRARIEQAGINTDQEIVTYCTGGIRSGFAAIILKIAGYQKVRNYNASFSGWAGTGQKIDYEVYEKLPV